MKSMDRLRRLEGWRAWSLIAGVALLILALNVTGRSQQEPPPPSAASAAAPSSLLSPVQEARDLVEVLEARVNIKKAELGECEVHLLHARRRLAAIERMQNVDYQQALERLRWAEGMHKKGYYTDSQLRSERQHAEQLNPNTGTLRQGSAHNDVK
jgi:hypothetical protein